MTESGPKVLESNRERKEGALAELFETLSQSDAYIVVFSVDRDGQTKSGNSFCGRISRGMASEMLEMSSSFSGRLEPLFNYYDEHYSGENEN